LSLSEQQHLVWDTAPRSKRQQHVLQIWGSHDPLGPPGYAYVHLVLVIEALAYMKLQRKNLMLKKATI